jgi:hypothetical protein
MEVPVKKLFDGKYEPDGNRLPRQWGCLMATVAVLFSGLPAISVVCILHEESEGKAMTEAWILFAAVCAGVFLHGLYLLKKEKRP